MPLDVVPVTTRRDLRRFVDLPWRLFDRKRFPQWVPPLRATVYDALDRESQLREGTANIGTFDYVGPGRDLRITLGNGSKLDLRNSAGTGSDP